MYVAPRSCSRVKHIFLCIHIYLYIYRGPRIDSLGVVGGPVNKTMRDEGDGGLLGWNGQGLKQVFMMEGIGASALVWPRRLGSGVPNGAGRSVGPIGRVCAGVSSVLWRLRWRLDARLANRDGSDDLVTSWRLSAPASIRRREQMERDTTELRSCACLYRLGKITAPIEML